MNLHAAVARRLEAGTSGGPIADAFSRVWGAMVRLDTPLRWRETARVVVVGGATLGGSGKTPLAIACAEALDETGARVTLVGHAYGASPIAARFVSEDDDVQTVGDEALLCRRHLYAKVTVTIAKSRQSALDLGLSSADVAVVDGPCQTVPRRATLALLAVDATEPWGAGRCPPRGDLRAPIAALLAAADRVVAIAPEGTPVHGLEPGCGLPVDRAWIVSNGVTIEGHSIGWRELRRYRVGLFTALARPHRIVRALTRHGISPVTVVMCADHGPARIPEEGAARGIDLWLCTSKCRSHLPAVLSGVPVATLEHSLRLETPLKAALARLDPGSARP